MPASIRNSAAAVIRHPGNTREEVERGGDRAQLMLSATPEVTTANEVKKPHQAMIHYRSLFEELVGEPETVPMRVAS